MASSEISWHSPEAEDALGHLGSFPNGLDSEQAKRRLDEHGPNAMGVEDRVSPLTLLGVQGRLSKITG